MLSIKASLWDLSQKFVWWFTRKKTGSRRFLRILAELYTDSYYDFSYDMRLNGEQTLLDRLSPLGMRTVVDAGANIGTWSLAAAKALPEATIHAFEISPSTYKTMVARLQGGRFVLNNVGLSNAATSLRYKDFGADSLLTTLVTRATYWDAGLVYCFGEASGTTGDIYCAEKAIEFVDVLKIDTEGADHLVLSGFTSFLEQQKIRVVQFEYGFLNSDTRILMRDFFVFLESKGYIVGKLWSDGVDFSGFCYWLNEFRSGPNYVAVRRDDAEIIRAISIDRESVFALPDAQRFKTHQLGGDATALGQTGF